MDEKLSRKEWVNKFCPYPTKDILFCMEKCEHGMGGKGCKPWLEYMGRI